MAKRTLIDARPFSVRRITSADWANIEQLFGEKGACGGCWCMTWRVPRGGKLWEERKGAKNRADFRKLVTSGQVYGCLAFCENEPIGWCCLGPRKDFLRLERIKALQTDWTDRTWSVTCFYIPARWRHRGVATALLQEAVKVAKANGAKEVEGYPVVPYYDDKDIPAAFAWTGIPQVFEKSKFVEITLPDGTRPIYRRRFR